MHEEWQRVAGLHQYACKGRSQHDPCVDAALPAMARGLQPALQRALRVYRLVRRRIACIAVVAQIGHIGGKQFVPHPAQTANRAHLADLVVVQCVNRSQVFDHIPRALGGNVHAVPAQVYDLVGAGQHRAIHHVVAPHAAARKRDFHLLLARVDVFHALYRHQRMAAHQRVIAALVLAGYAARIAGVAPAAQFHGLIWKIRRRLLDVQVVA